MELSPRLRAIAREYRQQASVWDIGCDHGLLGLSFLKEMRVKEVHLVDPSEPVMSQLKQYIDSYITDGNFKIHLHHCAGQTLKLSSEPKCIFIAGMGGKETRLIIEALLPQLGPQDQITLSPHKNLLELRRYLAREELGLQNESLVEDRGRQYEILSLRKDPQLEPVLPYGGKLWSCPGAEDYRQHQLRHFSLHQDELSRGYVEFLASIKTVI